METSLLWNLILRFSARFSSQENCQRTPIQLDHLRSNPTEKKTKLRHLAQNSLGKYLFSVSTTLNFIHSTACFQNKLRLVYLILSRAPCLFCLSSLHFLLSLDLHLQWQTFGARSKWSRLPDPSAKAGKLLLSLDALKLGGGKNLKKTLKETGWGNVCIAICKLV